MNQWMFYFDGFGIKHQEFFEKSSGALTATDPENINMTSEKRHESGINEEEKDSPTTVGGVGSTKKKIF